MTTLKYNNLDFNEIKQNLKDFLKSQDQFKDYNFDGTSLSILLDVLAYNTAYNAFYLNMISSEMFLDSASLYSSVASRAKHLGYVPSSAKSLRAVVDVTITPNILSAASGRLYINRDIVFRATVDGLPYDFVPENPVYTELNSLGKYSIRNLSLIQGKRLIHTYTVDNNLPIKQRFVVPNKLVDLSSLIITVTKSATNPLEEVFTLADDVTTLSPTKSIYFIQPYEDGLYEVVFGDGILGKKLENGNIIKLDYVVSAGDKAAGARNFVTTRTFNIVGGSTNSIVCTQPAYGYVAPETIDSIKLVAPRAFSSQNRAVTKLDYETLLKRDIPIIEHIRVWGGDEADPPVYGKVFCSIKPKSGYALNTDDKTRLIENFIKPRSILAMDVEIVEPDYIYLSVSTKVSYFADKTDKQDDDIKKIIVDGIKQFKTNNLIGFDSDFRHSKLVRTIDTLDSAIESNTTDVKIKYRFTPPFYTIFNQTIYINNPIDTGDAANEASAINSSEFVYKGSTVRLSDDGKGKLYLYYTLNNKRVVVNSNAGTVDYAVGKISIENIMVDRIPNNQIYIDIFVSPKDNDVIAYRNQIIRLEDEDISVDIVNLNKLRLS
jgi:hypothetical protein